MKEYTMVEKPFDWNDNFSKIAIEDFSVIQSSLPYATCQTIGMALAKLEMLEKQGCRCVDDKKLNRAIKDFIAQYGKANKSPFVHNPIAYALYHTWKKYDN